MKDAWTWVHNNINLRFGTQFYKEILRKKFSYLRKQIDPKLSQKKKKQNKKKTAKTFAEFQRFNSKTGGGPGIDPPNEDGEDQPHEDLLPFDVEESLKV